MQLKRLIVETAKPDKLRQFYENILGLSTETLTGHGIKIKIGSTELVFKQAMAADPFYHFAINIPANKIEEAKAWLKDRAGLIWIDQYKSDIADFVNWHAKSVYFFDPAGNILELIARFDLDNKTHEPFSSTQFLSVSEIGFVCKEDELDKKTGELLHQYHLSYFDKQPPLPQFKAVGDDEGLFIIVPENRAWFPTSKPSGIFPIGVEFKNAGIKWELKL